MLEGVEADGICRDEDCSIVELHMANDDRHDECLEKIKSRPHHRPKAKAPLAPPNPNYVPWKLADTEGLLDSVMKTTSNRVPRWFQEIRDGVRDDYGDVTDRTVWRAIKKLVECGRLIKFDIGLAFSAYMRPANRGRVAGRLDDVSEMREYMLGVVECHPTGRDSP